MPIECPLAFALLTIMSVIGALAQIHGPCVFNPQNCGAIQVDQRSALYPHTTEPINQLWKLGRR